MTQKEHPAHHSQCHIDLLYKGALI